MKHGLLCIVAAAALLVGAPASGQFVFIDVTGDGLANCTDEDNLIDDALNPTITAVDIYFVTDANKDGSAAVCNSAEPLTLSSYEFTLRYSGSGSVVYNGWTDNLGFPFPIITAGDGTFAAAGEDCWVGRGGNPPGLAPGKHKLGTLSIAVTGSPILSFATSSTLDPNAQTAFGSACDGNQLDSTIRLGDDFQDNCPTDLPIPVHSTTWGKIKKTYQ